MTRRRALPARRSGALGAHRICGVGHQGSANDQNPIVKSSSCDCDGCRRATGTLNVPFVSVRRAGFKVTAGEPNQFRAEAGVKCDAFGVWSFCSKCGTQLFWTGDTGDEIDIFAGTLDDTSVFQPDE